MVYVVARVTKATRTVPRTTVPALTCGETDRCVSIASLIGGVGGCRSVGRRNGALREPAVLERTRPVYAYIVSHLRYHHLRHLDRRWHCLSATPYAVNSANYCIEKRIPRRAARTRRRLSRSGLGKRPGAGRHAAEERRPEGCRAAKAGGVQAEEGSGGSLEIWQIARGERRRGVRGGRCDHGDARGSG